MKPAMPSNDPNACVTEPLYYRDGYATTCEAEVVGVEPRCVILDRTVFYPMGGGQPGDSGTLVCADGQVLDVIDTRLRGRAIEHHLAADTDIPVGTRVCAEIDWQRRYRHMRMHTCLHLLCSLIDAPVTGGSIADGRGRLDFDLPESTLDKEQLTADLRQLVQANAPVSIQWIDDEELDRQPDLVRTLSVAPPRGQGQVRLIQIEGIDLQPCGGTHLRSIGEIGSVQVRKIEKKGRQNRRVLLVLDAA